ncbi:hypothetical protein [Salipiger mangrovisoli]|uniref:Uncharacterized protein n=1 Tax=Salipiger mangrovisoli TaxID=2865933 RepID=A0ABR9WYF5_9RHOB|nr:hypothetical protein [Salipiger mangrovisoli]MBE9636281.1 hypothetical protein [Salipiger mangrovisoli]
MRDLLPALLLFVLFGFLPERLYAPLREGNAALRAQFAFPAGRELPAPAFPEASGVDTVPPAAAPAPRRRLQPRSARLFAGPGDVSPEDFAAYGVIAFNTPPSETEGDKTESARLLLICAAFVATLAPQPQPATPPARIVVTVWPMQSSAAAQRATQAQPREACPIALQRYQMPIARVAISAAVDSGLLNPFRRGPFLMAWQPGANFANPGKPILFDDLSDVTSAEEAHARFARWDADINHQDSYARGLIERMGRVAFTRLQLRTWAEESGPAWLSRLGFPPRSGDRDD